MKKLTPILQSTPPNDRNVLWADNSGDNISIKAWDNGKWKEIYSKPSPKVTTKIKEGKFLEKEYIGEYTPDAVNYNHLIDGGRESTQLDRSVAKVSDTCNVSLYYNDENSTPIYEGDVIIQEYTKDDLQVRFLSPKILTKEEMVLYLGESVETDLLFLYAYDNNQNLLFVNNSLLSGSENIEIGFKAKVKDSIITVTTDYETPMLVTFTSEDSSDRYFVSDTPVTEITEAINKGISVVGKLIMPGEDSGEVSFYGTFSNMQLNILGINSPILCIETSLFGIIRVIYDFANNNWICFAEKMFQPLYLISTGVSGKYRAFESKTPKETDTPHMFGEDFFSHYYLMYPDKDIKFYDSGDGRTSFSGIVHKTDGNVYIRTFTLVEMEDSSSPDYNRTLEQHDFLIGNTDTQV